MDYSDSQTLSLPGSSGELPSCSNVTDTTAYTAAGAAISGPPHLGELCYFGFSSVYFWDETSGSARYLSQNFYSGTQKVPGNPFDVTSPSTWYTLAGVYNPSAPNGTAWQFMKSVYNSSANHYVNNPIIFPGQPENSSITQTLLTSSYNSTSGLTCPAGSPANCDFQQQYFTYMASCCPLLQAATTAGFLSNRFGSGQFQGFYPNGYASIAASTNQNSFSWQFVYDLPSQTFKGVLDTFTGATSASTSGALVGLGRWGGVHTEKPTGVGPYSWIGTNVPGYNGGPPLSGPYTAVVDKVWRSQDGINGQWDTNTCLPDLGNSNNNGAQCTTTVSPIAGNNPFGPFMLTAAGKASNGNTVYTGTITPCASNACVGYRFLISGFNNSGNNNTPLQLGAFSVTASTSTSITVTNPNGVAETHAGSAAYVPAFAYSCPAGTSAFWATTQADANQQGATGANGGNWQPGQTLLPSPYYGQNNCIQIHMTSPPCEVTSIAAEKSTWPCPGNSNAASIQPLRVGDSWIDLNGSQCNDCEHGVIVQLTCNPSPCSISSTDITAWIYRSSLGINVVPYPALNISNEAAKGKMQHVNGWGLSVVGGGAGSNSPGQWWFNTSNTSAGWYVDNYFLSGTHADTTAATPGSNAIATCLLVPNGTFGCRSMLNLPGDFGTLNNYRTTGYNPFSFNGSSALLSFNPLDLETYPSCKQYAGSQDIKRFCADWHDLTSDSGAGWPTAQSSFMMTLSLLGSNVWRIIPTSGATIDEKSAPMYGNSGRYNLKNVSGPGSSISTAAGANQFCVARAANDCVNGSTAGYIYVNARQLENNPCQIDQVAISSPCVFPAPASFSQGTIYNVYDPNPEGSGHIRLTGMFSLPGATPHFQHLRFNSTGTWGFYSVAMASAYRGDIFAVRIPHIAGDTVNRTTFVPIRITLGAGNSAAIRFGYDLSFRCSGVTDSQGNFLSGYNDSCLTVASLTQSEPYMWSSEGTVQPVTCSSGCAVTIPAISERYLYYRVERYSSVGALTYTGPIQRIAVP